MPATLFFNVTGPERFPQVSEEAGVITFGPEDGTNAGSVMTVEGDVLTSFEAWDAGMELQFLANGPLTLVPDIVGIFRTVELNDDNGDAFLAGEPGGFFSPRVISVQADGAPGQWFGDYIVINGENVPWVGEDNNYHNGVAYGEGAAEMQVSDSSGGILRLGFYVESIADGQYLFFDMVPTGPDNSWEIDGGSLDGPYNLSDDQLYEGEDPMTVEVTHLYPYGEEPDEGGGGEEPTDPDLSEDKGFRADRGFLARYGFKARYGFLKRNGF